MKVLVPKHRERKRACPVGKRCKSWDDPDGLKEYLLAHRYVTKNGCWEWTGARSTRGYGAIRIENQMYYVHRVALYLSGYRGRKNAIHACDNPSCYRVDPKHVHPGTQKENMQDMAAKGRGKGFNIRCALPRK